MYEQNPVPSLDPAGKVLIAFCHKVRNNLPMHKYEGSDNGRVRNYVERADDIAEICT